MSFITIKSCAYPDTGSHPYDMVSTNRCAAFFPGHTRSLLVSHFPTRTFCCLQYICWSFSRWTPCSHISAKNCLIYCAAHGFPTLLWNAENRLVRRRSPSKTDHIVKLISWWPQRRTRAAAAQFKGSRRRHGQRMPTAVVFSVICWRLLSMRCDLGSDTISLTAR